MGNPNKKHTYEVRVREKVGPDKWQKISKFYISAGPKEAAACYQGSGKIMWVSKVQKDKIFGIGDFFSLGDRLLKEFASEVPLEKRLVEKRKREERRYHTMRRRSES